MAKRLRFKAFSSLACGPESRSSRICTANAATDVSAGKALCTFQSYPSVRAEADTTAAVRSRKEVDTDSKANRPPAPIEYGHRLRPKAEPPRGPDRPWSALGSEESSTGELTLRRSFAHARTSRSPGPRSHAATTWCVTGDGSRRPMEPASSARRAGSSAGLAKASAATAAGLTSADGQGWAAQASIRSGTASRAGPPMGSPSLSAGPRRRPGRRSCRPMNAGWQSAKGLPTSPPCPP